RGAPGARARLARERPPGDAAGGDRHPGARRRCRRARRIRAHVRGEAPEPDRGAGARLRPGRAALALEPRRGGRAGPPRADRGDRLDGPYRDRRDRRAGGRNGRRSDLLGTRRGAAARRHGRRRARRHARLRAVDASCCERPARLSRPRRRAARLGTSVAFESQKRGTMSESDRGPRIRRALMSVSDKTGVLDLARALHALGVEILSTGGTAKLLRDAGIPVQEVADYTGFPEMLDGRVKTLHPKVHGGLLGRRDLPEHVAAMEKHGLPPIDLVCVNLYPFREVTARGCSLEEAIENIDIGGPSMLRSAAKNHAAVTVVVDPADYEPILAEMREHDGATTLATRARLAKKVFRTTAAYD